MWSKFDDQFYLNPKNARMDRDEQDLYFAGIIYCNGQLTDGFIPGSVIVMLCAWAKIPLEANAQAIAQAIASRLVEHGFWENATNGYNVHDFLAWNLSRDEVLALKSARSEAGKRGGKASGAKRQANGQAIASANALANSKQNPTQSQSQLIKDKEGANAPLPDSPAVRGVNFSDPVWDLLHGQETEPSEPEPKIDITWLAADNTEMGAAFLTATKLPPPSDRSTQGYWNRELRRMRKDDHLSVDDIRRAVKKMRDSGGIIKSPESVRTVALDMKAANSSVHFAETY